MAVKNSSKWIIILSTLLIYPTTSTADTYLSTNFCGIAFATLEKGMRKKGMTNEQRYKLLSKIQEQKNKPCLREQISNWKVISKRFSNTQYRRKKFGKTRCAGLPSTFWTDHNGNKIFKVTNQQMELLEIKMIDNELLADCIAPYLDY